MALPKIVQRLIVLIGHTKTMALIDAFGGQTIRFPRDETTALFEALVETIGRSATLILAAELGGWQADEYYIPFCRAAIRADRNRTIINRYDALLAGDHSCRGAISVLVREFKLSNRQIQKIVNQPLPAPSEAAAQGALF